MDDFCIKDTKDGFTMKLWRGERMCLLGFDVEGPEPDLVGFAVECKEPGSAKFHPLLNRLAFSYDKPVEEAVTGARKFDSRLSPFQKFRWVHFPFEPKPGIYVYRATKMHMPTDNPPVKGTSIELTISLDSVTYAGFIDVGFTRGFASSQAFLDKFPKGTDIDAVGKTIIPVEADNGLTFPKFQGHPADIYRWLGFEAYDLFFGFLDEAISDATIEVDFFAYDLNEPDVVAKLQELGGRLRAIIDNSTSKNKAGKLTGHGVAASAESHAAKQLQISAGAARVKRMHFTGLQHNKVLIAKRNGVPVKILAGSMNFSFRGIYIQSNNILVFNDANIASLYGQAFDLAFTKPASFASSALASKWHVVQAAGRPPVHFCFSPHKNSDISLNPVRGAIEQATSSVFYCVAFLNQIKSGPTKEAFDRLTKRPIFSYGVSDKRGSLELKKPNGDTGLVDFAYLAQTAPQPFKAEWSGQGGINVHHKFVVTDFGLPTAKVFTGSSNLSPSGEEGNGDNLILIEDPRIATSYAISAALVFDHLHFRNRMRDALKDKKKPKAKLDALTLKKPAAISGKPAWFEDYYKDGSQLAADRKVFST
jgi:phosphatidylserine/phosphatidylglycerophosphate/cardiolipin synthase-like enzyme